jgi:hypothetical protein
VRRLSLTGTRLQQGFTTGEMGFRGQFARQQSWATHVRYGSKAELEDLRAGINHHRREGLCNKIVEVVLPPERPPRERWLTRPEAARLIGLLGVIAKSSMVSRPTGGRDNTLLGSFLLHFIPAHVPARCAPRPTTHRRDVADASRDGYVGGGWLSRHDY